MVEARYYLPDTNILIYALSGMKPHSSRLEEWIKTGKLALSSIVVAEFLAGATKKEGQAFTNVINNFKVFPVDIQVAMAGAGYKKEFGRKSKKVWLSDCLIAATCKVFGAVLVTADRKDYPMKDIVIQTS